MNRPCLALRTSLSLASAVALLVACGGGGGDADTTPPTVPPSATASPEAFTQFVSAQVEDDLIEPVVLNGVVPPSSETAEPLPVVR
jgi:hypothetical protein